MEFLLNANNTAAQPPPLGEKLVDNAHKTLSPVNQTITLPRHVIFRGSLEPRDFLGKKREIKKRGAYRVTGLPVEK